LITMGWIIFCKYSHPTPENASKSVFKCVQNHEELSSIGMSKRIAALGKQLKNKPLRGHVGSVRGGLVSPIFGEDS
jgi:hypothetical protein